MVKKVTDSGLKLSSLGSPVIYSLGDYCTIHTYDGKEFTGTVLPNNPSVHVNREISKTKLNYDNIYVRVDVPLKKKNDHLKSIEVGNFVSFDPKFHYVEGFVKSRYLDDKASCGILLYLADILKKNLESIPHSVYLYFNVTEETGQGIAAIPDIDELLISGYGLCRRRG